MKNRKYISLLAAIALIMAYTLPFCSASFADEVDATELMAVNDSLGLTTISENYTFIAQTALSEKNITANMSAADKLNDYVYGRCKYITNKGNSVIGEAECLNVFGVKNKDYYMAFNVSAGATITVYGKNSGKDKRYFTAATAVNKRDIAVSDIFEGNQAGVFTFQVQNDETVYIASYQVASGAETPADGDGGGDMTIAGFTVTFDTVQPPAPTGAPSTETPSTETPSTETPSTQTPSTEAPSTETPSTQTPSTEAPSTEAPSTQTPSTEEPVTATPTPTAAATPTPAATSAPEPTEEPSELTPDEKAVRDDAKKLMLKTASQTAIYMDIELDKKGSNGSVITWESSNEKYIDIQEISHAGKCYTGTVTRPTAAECTDGGVPVTLTATLKKGEAEYKKTFEVSAREWKPTYYNNFQQDVGKEAEGKYQAIADNITAVNGDTFRGIRVDTLKESRSFDEFGHNAKDVPSFADKRLMSIDDKYGKLHPIVSGEETDENFAFYYGMYKAYGGDSASPLWIKLTDPNTGTAPKGVVIMSMDICILSPHQFATGLGTSKAGQMCRFMLGKGAEYLRYFDNESAVDFMGGKSGYTLPKNEWIRATVVANSQTHKWDFYYDGMQVATNLNFRNAQDMFPTIEFAPERNSAGGKFLIDNIYVENITEDYRDTYWEALDIAALSQNENGEYVANGAFTLQYQGTDGLSGNKFSWTSSDENILKIETKRIPVDELINCGYTAEEIEAYKSKGVTNPIVVLATPQSVSKDSVITLTAKMQIDDVLKTKEFKVLVRKNGAAGTDDEQKAREDADAIKCVKNGETITSNVNMDSLGSLHGSKITWKSSNENVFSAKGIVSKPSENAITVTLTASVQYGSAVEYRTFNVSVQPKSSGGGGGGGGGGSSIKSNSSGAISSVKTEPVISTRQPAKKPMLTEEAFNDINKTEWAREAIEYLFSKDIINGYGDGSFGVNDNVTREQFVRMLLTALDIKLTSDKNNEFKDVPDGEWYSNYVNTAVELGIVTGMSEAEFGVGREISRQDMAVMCKRALEYITDSAETAETDEMPEPTSEPEETSESEATAEPEATSEPEATAEPEATSEPEATAEPEVTSEPEATAASEEEPDTAENTEDKKLPAKEIAFADKDSIADYALEAIALMAGAGYINGDDKGNFAPQKSLTRAEAAVVLYRIITEGI